MEIRLAAAMPDAYCRLADEISAHKTFTVIRRRDFAFCMSKAQARLALMSKEPPR